ncbi:DUF6816 family protein [Myxosarcina sp. GI1]|uniref:DUF6816 family protein n=1 Tax=Myxosarcina sp. GI1 TaxID=1541065 RepID=UPI000562AD2F
MVYRICILILILLSFTPNAIASTMTERLDSFPDWNNKPSVQTARGDLEFPDWMAGTWEVTSTLVEQFAPLAPDIVTPGFEDNRSYFNKAIAFQVRFGREYDSPRTKFFSLYTSQPAVVADRAFNSKNITQAYLGTDSVYRVKVDPSNPNRQITLLRGDKRLVSTVTERYSEQLAADEFLATEIIEQLFKSPERIYLNQVEILSDYQFISPENIRGEQITAIYLSPQDPDYFKAGNRPVALYHYHLVLKKQITNKFSEKLPKQ